MADTAVRVPVTTKGFFIGLALLIVGGIFLYARAKKAGSLVPLDLPNNGAGIPSGWTAVGDVIKLHNAFEGFGTDEEGIFATLSSKTNDQLIAIKNEYAHRFKKDLFEEFNDELSGDDLTRALEYYKNIV